MNIERARLEALATGHDYLSALEAVLGQFADKQPWRADAACTGSGVDFFPDDDDVEGIAAAIAVCQACPVIDECRAWAVEHREVGVWGGRVFGFSPDALRMRRYRARQKALRAA